MNIIGVVKAAFFLSVPFFLIGHGASGIENAFKEPCERSGVDQENDTYYIASTVEYGGLVGDGTFRLIVNGASYSRASGQIFGPIRNLDEGESFSISIDSNQTEAEFGQMLLLKGRCADSSKTIKLSAPIIADRVGEFFEATYQLRDADFGVGSSSAGASMSTYILSGGETGSESISVPSSLEVFVNSVLVYDGNDGDINAPISFAAALDDEVEIVINSLGLSGTTSQLWLHAPNGEGARLSYNVELTANSEFRAIYKISSSL